MARSKSAAKKSAAKKAGEDAEVPVGGQESLEDTQAAGGGKEEGRCNAQEAPCSQKGCGDSQGESARVCQSEDHRQHPDAHV